MIRSRSAVYQWITLVAAAYLDPAGALAGCTAPTEPAAGVVEPPP
ncbi:hypothetical protein ABT297_29360 [Dactylosporangium sp. NPDC000555]